MLKYFSTISYFTVCFMIYSGYFNFLFIRQWVCSLFNKKSHLLVAFLLNIIVLCFS
jgi:hypothetical protein